MKKILCFILALLTFALFVSCNTNSGEPDGDSSLVISTEKSYVIKEAEQGIISGCEYKIGESIDTIYKDYNLDSNGQLIETASEDINNFAWVSGTDTVKIDTGSASYYYYADSKENGVVFIANFEESYDFNVGFAQIQDVKDTIAVNPTEEKVVYNPNDSSSEKPWFYKVTPTTNVTIVRYAIDKYDLSFYFENDRLAATTLCDTSLWSK